MLTDIELVKNAQSGDYQSEIEIFSRYKNLLRKVCRSYFLIGGEVEDLMQEASIGLFKAIKGFSFEKNDNFSSFASLCVHRQVQSAIKKASTQNNSILSNALPLIYEKSFDEEENSTEINIATDEMGPFEVLLCKEAIEEIKTQIKEKLSSREVKVLNEYLQGKSYDEIHNKTGFDKKAIDNALSRIKNKLQFLKEKK